MKNLVTLTNNELTTTSNLVAKELGVEHRHMMQRIKNFAVGISTVRFDEMYTESTWGAKGQTHKNYTMNRDGYMFLVMNIGTKKAHGKKLAFIDAFNAMEKAILQGDKNKDNQEWLATRAQSKAARLQQTDVIKTFVEYATAQGSANAKHYYKHVTNATYSALQLMQHKKPALRDTLDGMQLAQLMVAENAAKASMLHHMGAGEHYKVIYVLVKADLEALAEAMGTTKVLTEEG